ncbi:MAG: N-methyl-L-tryptophan oxidase [Phycisphaerales bacterium]
MTASTTHFDAIVLGVGVMGAATLLSLARRGVRALGLEQFTIPNHLGSSHGESRIFRVGYYEHPDYVPLLQKSRAAWLALNAEIGQEIFLPTGGLWIGPRASELIAGTLHAAQLHTLSYELVVEPDELRKRAPFLQIHDSSSDDGIIGFFEKDACTLRPEAAVAAIAQLARNSGATICEHARVQQWNCTSSSVTVTTQDHDTFSADRLIITAGPWSNTAIASDAVRCQTTRQIAAWFEVQNAQDGSTFGPNTMPCWAMVRNDHGFYYGFPSLDGSRTAKVSLHERGSECDPNNLDRTASQKDVEVLQQFVTRSMPGLRSEPVRTSVCMYTNSCDGHFLLDHHPDHAGRVVIGCGFSGHGFKFAPMIGEILADLALKGTTIPEAAFLARRT